MARKSYRYYELKAYWKNVILKAFSSVKIPHQTYSWKSRHREGRKSGHPPWLYVVSALNHMMLMVNSSINFIIYCAFGSKFRRVVMEKLYPNFYNVRSRHANSNGLDVVRTNENNLVSVFRILMKVMMLYCDYLVAVFCGHGSTHFD